MRFAHLGTLVLTLAVAQVTVAHSIQELAADLAAADQEMRWEEPAQPFPIVGPISFVGTQGLGIFLIVTSDGLIL